MSNAMKIVQGIPTEADSITETLFKKTNNTFNSTRKVSNAANVYKFVANEVQLPVQLPVLKDFFQTSTTSATTNVPSLEFTTRKNSSTFQQTTVSF